MIRALGNLNGIAQARCCLAGSSRVPSGALGKLYVPVAPALVGYSQFKHVAGVAAEKGQYGVNITKISILNTLIERLTGMKKAQTPAPDTSRMNDRQLDALIEDYQSRIKSTISIAKTNPYVLAGAPFIETGSLFSISA